MHGLSGSWSRDMGSCSSGRRPRNGSPSGAPGAIWARRVSSRPSRFGLPKECTWESLASSFAVGGSVLSRKERSGKDEGRLSHAPLGRSLFPYAAVLLIVIAAVISLAPSPERTLGLAASDFQLRTVPGRGPYATLFWSRLSPA